MKTYRWNKFWMIDHIVSAFISICVSERISHCNKPASLWNIRLLKPRDLLGTTNDRVGAIASPPDLASSTSSLRRLVVLGMRNSKRNLPPRAVLDISKALLQDGAQIRQRDGRWGVQEPAILLLRLGMRPIDGIAIRRTAIPTVHRI